MIKKIRFSRADVNKHLNKNYSKIANSNYPASTASQILGAYSIKNGQKGTWSSKEETQYRRAFILWAINKNLMVNIDNF